MNDAIARRDLDAIAAFFLPTYHVVTARSMQRNGKEESVKSWADMFARDHSSTHTRTPEDIRVNTDWGMAHEQGRWTNRLMANDGPLELIGVYAAKWHATQEGWLLQAEVFTLLDVRR